MRKSLTNLEKERLHKKNKAELEEKIDLLGQESDKKAKPLIIEEQKEQEKKQKQEEAEKMEKLTDARKKLKKYIETVMTFLHGQITNVKMPLTYKWGVWYDGKGVRVAIRDKKNKLYQRAFKVTFDPKYDLFAVDEFVVWIEDIFDRSEGYVEVKENLWTPKPN